MDNTPAQPSFLEFLPVSLFGSVMALCGLSFSWGWAEKTWGTPAWIKDLFAVLAILIFAALVVAYLMKCVRYSELVKKEFDHPVSVSFFGTIIVSILLLPGIILPYSVHAAVVLWSLGAIMMFAFAWFVLRKWLDHQQEPGNAMPAWIIPIVATLDVPIVGYRLPIPGIHEICLLFFGIGILFTLILMPILFSRLLFQPQLPEALKPTLLILVGPFALAFSGYESLTGTHDMLASVFFYFDFFLLCLFGSKLFLLPQCCPFRVSWWSVGFPLVAFTLAAFRFAAHMHHPVINFLPGFMLGLSTVVILYLFGLSLYKLATKQFLLPKPANERATQLLEPLAK